MASSVAANTCSNGRIAVVTGSNKGIGYFIALQLATSGLFEHIILACRDSQRAATAVKSIEDRIKSLSVTPAPTISSVPLSLGDTESHKEFCACIETKYGKLDCLVNNAAIAYKNADPTPFEQQTKPTLDVNFRGTVDLTERLLPLLKKGNDPRIVNVASMSGRLSQVSPALQKQFTSKTLTMDQLHTLINDYESSVYDGTYISKGWGRSNYGLSKLAVIAATKVWARESPDIAINCCCPGYCKTDMTSQSGIRPPEDGARNAVIPATMENPPTGELFSNYVIANW